MRASVYASPVVKDFGFWIQRAMPALILLVAVVSVPVMVFQPTGLPRLRALEREHREVTTENAEIRREIARLRGEVKLLRDDPTTVERIARDQLGLVRKSELVIYFGRPK